jgi:hypothetical protein
VATLGPNSSELAPTLAPTLPGVLDLDAFRSVGLDVRDGAWPLHVAGADAVPEILRLIRRTRGGVPGL